MFETGNNLNSKPYKVVKRVSKSCQKLIKNFEFVDGSGNTAEGLDIQTHSVASYILIL